MVTTDKALQLSAVWACIRLLSESISTLPLKLYHRESDGSRSLAQQHPAYPVLCRCPNLEMTPSRFVQMIVASFCLRGNAFVEKRRSVSAWSPSFHYYPKKSLLNGVITGD